MAHQSTEQLETELEVVYGALVQVTRGMGPAARHAVLAARLKGMREVLETASVIGAPEGEEWTKFRARHLRASRYRMGLTR